MDNTDERKFISEHIVEDAGPYQSIAGDFKAEKYVGHPLLDTQVSLEIPSFTITWSKKEELMKELAQLISKYQI